MRSDIATVIAYYNGSKFIERALISLKKQSIPSDEIIVIDDGSEESEHQFLQKIVTKYDFKILRKMNGGQGSARNFGVKNSKSKYVTFLDQDDFYLEEHNEILLENLPIRDARFGWVYGDLWHADEEGGIINMSILSETKCSHPKKNIKEMIASDMFILPSAALISKKAFLAVGGFDEQFTGYEDDDLFMRLFRGGWTNYFVNKPVSVWCINEGSTSYSAKMAVSRVRYFVKLLNSFPDAEFTGSFYGRDIIVPRFVNMVISQGINYCRRPKKDAHIYMEAVIEFKKIINGFDFVEKKHKILLEEIIAHLKLFISQTSDCVGDFKSISDIRRKGNSSLYDEREISGKKVKFLNIEKMKGLSCDF